VAGYYVDSSGLVKRYVNEIGTPCVTSLCAAKAGYTIYTVRITAAEIVAALFRRVRIGTLDLARAQAAATQFRQDVQTRYQIVEVTEPLVDHAMTLAETQQLRGYDAVQLAAALAVQNVRSTLSLAPLTFVSADDQLNAAALAEGLPVENPNQHP
jgi:predicted nucleic acid-binding protein